MEEHRSHLYGRFARYVLYLMHSFASSKQLVDGKDIAVGNDDEYHKWHINIFIDE